MPFFWSIFYLEIKCSPAYPYAFMWGEYCCKTEWEGTSENNLDACDGSLISINSICCKDNQYDKCPNMVGCKNNRGKQNWIGNTKISLFL